MAPDPLIQSVIQALAPFQNSHPIVAVACSGGLDSTVLLDATSYVLPSERLVVLHVDHAISPHSAHWCTHVHTLAHNRQLAFYAERLQYPTECLTNHSPSLSETRLRQARYRALERGMIHTGAQILLMAHHAHDQAETVIMRLSRGAGLWGSQGIPAYRQWGDRIILRPFLGHSRAQLIEYAQSRALPVITDPSNAQWQHPRDPDRNYIRHGVWPAVEARYPDAVRHWSQYTQDQSQLLQLVERYLLQAICDPGHACLYPARGPWTWGTLDFQAVFSGTDPFYTDLLLKYWLEKILGTAPLTRIQLAQIQRDVIHARSDAQPCFQWGNPNDPWIMRRYRSRLYVWRPGAADSHAITLFPDRDQIWEWDPQHPLDLPVWGPLYREQVQVAQGVLGSDPDKLPDKLQVVVYYHSGNQKAWKKKWQAWGVPPWDRCKTPVLYRVEPSHSSPQKPKHYGWAIPLGVLIADLKQPTHSPCYLSSNASCNMRSEGAGDPLP